MSSPAEPPSHLIMHRPLSNLPPESSLPEGYALRRLGSNEDEALFAVLDAAFPEIQWTLERTRRALIGAPDVPAVYVITWQDEPVATASVRYLPDRFPGEGIVHWVGVRPDHRGRALGRVLTARVLHHFAEDGYTAAVLETDDFRIPAIKTYLSLGFRPRFVQPDHDARWQAIFQKLSMGA